MPKRNVDLREWYAVLTLTDGDGYNSDAYPTTDFSDDELADIKRIETEFRSWQEKIAQRFGIKSNDSEDFILDDAEAVTDKSPSPAPRSVHDSA